MSKKKTKREKDMQLLQKAQQETIRWVSEYRKLDRTNAEIFVNESYRIQIINQVIKALK
ncbi:MAG: hypothetical protein ACKOWO_08020 [Sediminibacterium sp.]